MLDSASLLLLIYHAGLVAYSCTWQAN